MLSLCVCYIYRYSLIGKWPGLTAETEIFFTIEKKVLQDKLNGR